MDKSSFFLLPRKRPVASSRRQEPRHPILIPLEYPSPTSQHLESIVMIAQTGDSIIAILGFHKIGPPPPTSPGNHWYIPENTFRSHLRYLSSHGWQIISVDTFLNALSVPAQLPRRAVLLTFDDAYKSLLRFAAPCLREHGCPSVVFVPTHFVGGYNAFDAKQPPEPICSWDDLRELARHGFSIQSHGVTHRSLRHLTPEEQEDELQRSKTSIEAELGTHVQVFAYPYGVFPADQTTVRNLLKQTGYSAAFAFPGGPAVLSDDRYFLPRVGMYPDSDLAQELGRFAV